MIKFFFDSLAGCILLVAMLICLAGSLWVLKVTLDECMSSWNIKATVYWKDCPNDVKKAVKSIEDRQRYLHKLRDSGKITAEKFCEEIRKLEIRLDELERSL